MPDAGGQAPDTVSPFRGETTTACAFAEFADARAASRSARRQRVDDAGVAVGGGRGVLVCGVLAAASAVLCVGLLGAAGPVEAASEGGASVGAAPAWPFRGVVNYGGDVLEYWDAETGALSGVRLGGPHGCPSPVAGNEDYVEVAWWDLGGGRDAFLRVPWGDEAYPHFAWSEDVPRRYFKQSRDVGVEVLTVAGGFRVATAEGEAYYRASDEGGCAWRGPAAHWRSTWRLWVRSRATIPGIGGTTGCISMALMAFITGSGSVIPSRTARGRRVSSLRGTRERWWPAAWGAAGLGWCCRRARRVWWSGSRCRGGGIVTPPRIGTSVWVGFRWRRARAGRAGGARSGAGGGVGGGVRGVLSGAAGRA